MKMSKATVRIESRPREPSIPPAIRYRLSDVTYKLMGWTKESSSAVAYPVVIMRAKFANRNISPWFRQRNKPVVGSYPNGTKAYIANEDATGKIYYPNKELAARIVKGGRYRERTRIWLYDTTEVGLDGMKHPHKICAVFDSLGNGIIYDQYMNKRLLYNQSAGVILDTPSNVPVFWKWHDFAYSEGTQKNEDTESSTSATDKRRDISITSQKKRGPASDVSNKLKSMSSVKTTTSFTVSDRDLAADEINYIDTGKLLPLKVSPIKPIAFRINRYFSLRIFSQSEIVLTFYAEGLHTVLKIGVLYNPYDKLKVIEVEDPALLTEKVLCPIEFYPEKTGSMMKLKKILRDKKVKKVEIAAETKKNGSSRSSSKEKKKVTISKKIGKHQKTRGTMTPVDLDKLENRMYLTLDEK